VPLRPKNKLGFQDYEVTQVLGLDLKKAPVYFNWNFLFNGPPLLTLSS